MLLVKSSLRRIILEGYLIACMNINDSLTHRTGNLKHREAFGVRKAAFALLKAKIRHSLACIVNNLTFTLN